MSVSCPRNSEKVVKWPGTGVTDGYEPIWGAKYWPGSAARVITALNPWENSLVPIFFNCLTYELELLWIDGPFFRQLKLKKNLFHEYAICIIICIDIIVFICLGV